MPALRDRILALDAEIFGIDAAIALKESELNALIYTLYHSTPEYFTKDERG